MSLQSGPWDINALRQPVAITDQGNTPNGVQKITYANEPYRGRGTSVFAYMSLPKTSAWQRDGKVPAIVLVHGGGGAAFEYWVRMWNDAGYAAIAMDLGGCDAAGMKLPDFGPNQEHDGKFDHIRLGLKACWSYHAIAAIFRAHTILATLPGVDENRIGITGISWGGYLTSLVAGLDDRNQFAIPVYGCGHLTAASTWMNNPEAEGGFNNIGEELTDLWMENFDPSAYLDQVTYPMLFVNGTNDFAYHPPAWQNTYLQSQGPVENFAPQIEEFLPKYIMKELDLIDKPNAIKQIHFPEDEQVLDKARERLIFEELFLIQLRMALLRKENKKTQKTSVIEIKKDGFVEQFVKALPFELTRGQKKAFEEIASDLNSEEPMQRLLQGDVGSGKTVVAAMTLLAAIENGYQAAIMAPTEILAEQHYKNFVDWLTPLGLSVGLFVGKHGAKIRKEMHQNLKNGQMNIAVGTHALIQEGVEFANLGAVVIDEQHRFGVKQRTKLKGKAKACEMLTMTATPIPRTLALTVHGDLDITLIDELPKGRKPIKTLLISAGARKKAYELIDREIQKGQQAYVVFPLIEESESLSAKAATKEAERLAEKIFPQYKIGLVHGKLKPAEKDKIMNEFRNKKYDILVSTTVIEVGVDVPNATVMLIENAERFGLSQLHQLRGRVGRSDLQSYCVLATDSKMQQTVDRLSIMTKTNNGFIIAEKDMEIRGPGEFMGTRQSGLPDLLLADITKDVEMLETARKYAFEFVENKNIKHYPSLNKKVADKILEGLELIASG